MNASTYQHQANLKLWADRIAEQKSSGLKIDEWCPVSTTFATDATPCFQNCETNTSCTSSKPTFTSAFKISTADLSLEINASLSSDTIVSIIKAVRNA